ncbi:MAG: DUF3592 domain-containing protein [bacterium]|nr:DUF3592 domain-containing protein [bacterium]
MITQNNNISGQDEHSDGNSDTVGKLSLIARGGMLIFGLIWTSGVAAMLSFIVMGLYQDVRMVMVYKATDAVVIAYTAPVTKTDEFGDDESTTGIIKYRYEAAGKVRNGEHHQNGQFANEYSKKLSRLFEIGDHITAWCDPDDPESSTLEPVAQPQLLGAFIFMLTFVAVSLRMIVTALTGRKPQTDFSPTRSGGKEMSVNMRGGGAYFGVFMVLCPVSAIAFFGISMSVSWKTGWAIGLLWMLVGIPLTTFAIGRMFSARKKAKTRPPVTTGFPSRPIGTFGIEDTTTQTPSTRLPSCKKTLLGAAGLTLFWCGLTGVFVAFVAHAIYQSHDARKRFVSTNGEVIASKVKAGGDNTYEPIIKYSYIVNGKKYTSQRYTFGSSSSSDRSLASDIVKNHPPGKKITVWYDPGKPTEATISIETPSLYYFLLLFLQPFIVIGIGGIIYTITTPSRFRRDRDFLDGKMRLPWSIPEWGTLRQDMYRLVLYPCRMPLMGFAAGYALTCFLGTFAVGIYYGANDGHIDNLDPAIIGKTFVVAGFVGILSAIVSLFKRKAIVEIDRHNESLHLKSSKREFSISLAEIDHWFLKMVLSTVRVRRNNESETQMAPMLALITTDGTEKPVHVFGSSEEQGLIAEKAAEEFAKLTNKPFNGMHKGQSTTHLSNRRARAKEAKKYADLA